MGITTASKQMTQDSPGVRLIPPFVFYGCLLLGGVIELFIPSQIPLLSNHMRIVFGLLGGGLGFLFMMLAHEKFKRIKTHVHTNMPASTFITKGAYRFSRNPMYVGGSAFFLGIGLTVGSIWMMVAYLPLGLYLSRYVVPREEAYMQRTFGEDYNAYCRNVRRWV